MKYIKKINNLLLALTLILVSVIVPSSTVEAKTLKDLKKELQELESNYYANQKSKQLTEKELANVKSNINSVSNEIENSQTEIKDLNEQISQLEVEIETKKEEIKEFIQYYQLSNGESAYLEYVFGASDYTDFIYRLAVTEQMTKYNDELVTRYNDTIESNKQKTKELADKQVQLANKQDELSKSMEKLGDQLSSITDERVSIEEEIKMQKEAIDYYQNQLKCDENEDISVCGRNKLPANTAFYRPIISGYVTSEYGQRSFDYHYGIDLSTTQDGAPIYAAAGGVVISVVYRSSCGGTKVYIHHNVNGKTYTTSYVHMREALVQKGQVVTTNTQVGIMGGDPSKETWDQCSTGRHVHFSISNGLYLKDYMAWNSFLAKSINPRNLVNLPTGRYNWFTNRTTKY